VTKWPRYCELLLGLWLIASGWIIEDPSRSQYRAVTITSGVLILVLDILSVSLYQRYAHLLILPVSAALLAFGFLRTAAEAQGTQNAIVVALLLLMFAILPTEATQPPPSWRELRDRSGHPLV
jgi:hypothetical protein